MSHKARLTSFNCTATKQAHSDLILQRYDEHSGAGETVNFRIYCDVKAAQIIVESALHHLTACTLSVIAHDCDSAAQHDQTLMHELLALHACCHQITSYSVVHVVNRTHICVGVAGCNLQHM